MHNDFLRTLSFPSYTILVGKGTRGRYKPAMRVKGEHFAKLTAAMVPNGYRAKIELS